MSVHRRNQAAKVGIIAAFPAELQPLVRGWRRRDLPRGDAAWTGNIGSEAECAAVAAGMGGGSAERACQIAESLLGGLEMLASVGFAGALAENLDAGSAYSPTRVIDAGTGECFAVTRPTPPSQGPVSEPELALVTIGHVAGREEKPELRTRYGALLVDMEAATVARFARDRHCAFLCIKAVSDRAKEALPDFAAFCDRDGKLRKARLGFFLALRPQSWATLARMGKNSKNGAEAIAEVIAKMVPIAVKEGLKNAGGYEIP